MTTENDNNSAADEVASKTNENNSKNTNKAKQLKKPEHDIPRGMPKSKRPWKTPKTK